MWNVIKHVWQDGIGYKVLIGRNFCKLKGFSVGFWVRRTLSTHGKCVHDSDIPSQTHVKTSPPWRVLFFGTDNFAVESLKVLIASREESNEKVVESLEVVTLLKDLPVRRFAKRNKLVVHDWPHVNTRKGFDVGVVVSFGCLLKEDLIRHFPYGILNVHPSLLPRWRGPAPVFHTVLHGDSVSGVTVMQIRPKRFDVGPILNQAVYEVPEHITAEQLGATLASKGANLLIDTLRNLPERIVNRREQSKDGATLAPKISVNMSWIVWEEQTCDQIGRLFRAIGSQIPLRTTWMGETIKLLDFVGKFNASLPDSEESLQPGSVHYQKESNTLLVKCKDGWVGFKAVVLRKRLSAADFYNGYLHQYCLKKVPHLHRECSFQSNKMKTKSSPHEKERSEKLKSHSLSFQ